MASDDDMVGRIIGRVEIAIKRSLCFRLDRGGLVRFKFNFLPTSCMYTDMRLTRLATFLIFLSPAVVSVGAATKTQAQLILSREVVRPGETVMAGVLLKMPAGWHTYWKNSGDSGAPPKNDWQLPEGIKAGETRSEERRVGKEWRSRWSPEH